MVAADPAREPETWREQVRDQVAIIGAYSGDGHHGFDPARVESQ